MNQPGGKFLIKFTEQYYTSGFLSPLLHTACTAPMEIIILYLWLFSLYCSVQDFCLFQRELAMCSILDYTS